MPAPLFQCSWSCSCELTALLRSLSSAFFRALLGSFPATLFLRSHDDLPINGGSCSRPIPRWIGETVASHVLCALATAARISAETREVPPCRPHSIVASRACCVVCTSRLLNGEYRNA